MNFNTAPSIPTYGRDDGVGGTHQLLDVDSAQTLTNKTLAGAVLTTPQVGGIAPVSLTAGTLTLSPALHDGKYVSVNILSGAAITLPPATGSGATYKIIVGTSLTSGSLSVAVANAADYFRGQAYTFVTTVASTFGTANSGTVSKESDTFTMNHTTTGLGTIGDFIELVDMAAHIWAIEADYASSAAAASPFSAAV